MTMKKNIFRQAWAVIAAVPAIVIGGLIVNSFTHWSGALAHTTNVVWEAASQATLGTLTYPLPIWVTTVIVAFVALTWYANRKIGKAPKASSPSPPNFLTYTEDFFDGVLCRWEYIRPFGVSSYQIGNILCFCQHCEFVIGTPNEHTPNCPSCSRRAVRSGNPPFRTCTWPDIIAGYQYRENPMPFEDFIRREIERRARTGDW